MRGGWGSPDRVSASRQDCSLDIGCRKETSWSPERSPPPPQPVLGPHMCCTHVYVHLQGLPPSVFPSLLPRVGGRSARFQAEKNVLSMALSALGAKPLSAPGPSEEPICSAQGFSAHQNHVAGVFTACAYKAANRSSTLKSQQRVISTRTFFTLLFRNCENGSTS